MPTRISRQTSTIASCSGTITPALLGEIIRASRSSILERIAASPQAIVMYPKGGRMLPDEVLRELGVVPAVTTLRTPYFMSTPWMIAETDLVMCVSRRVAERLASVTGFQVLLLPNSRPCALA
jgi:hypothetical protein